MLQVLPETKPMLTLTLSPGVTVQLASPVQFVSWRLAVGQELVPGVVLRTDQRIARRGLLGRSGLDQVTRAVAADSSPGGGESGRHERRPRGR